jgi:hypothetical protein
MSASLMSWTVENIQRELAQPAPDWVEIRRIASDLLAIADKEMLASAGIVQREKTT